MYRYDFELYEQIAIGTWKDIIELYRNLMCQTGDKVFRIHENKMIAYEALSRLMYELDNFDEVFRDNRHIDSKQYLFHVKDGVRNCINYLNYQGIDKDIAPIMHHSLRLMYEEIVMRLVAGRDYQIQESDIL
ncbi:TPA: hypothetical protein PBS81_002658 [Staphylococcus aureus]|nr:hypothetical protein [Staphylococcus aureus]HDG8588266.1 hypothetical protein [Staphylococcus aureus]HDZ3299502.1 hypothetical protein [Staphylococcus aureus]HDZ3317742.1 hypothetical protein [Staphylococcus aureus]HDZ3342097.1 hypothetical protein [Staphylococcus aureus]